MYLMATASISILGYHSYYNKLSIGILQTHNPLYNNIII